MDNVYPDNWINPEPALCYNLVAIGAGTGGLVTAAGAAGLGARVALVERHLFGYGWVPSKTIVHSAQVASDIKNCELFGIKLNSSASVDFTSVIKLNSYIFFYLKRTLFWRLNKIGHSQFHSQKNCIFLKFKIISPSVFIPVWTFFRYLYNDLS